MRESKERPKSEIVAIFERQITGSVVGLSWGEEGVERGSMMIITMHCNVD